MWLAHILARCPALLQFLQTTSAKTLHSLTECTVLPQRRHFPRKKVSASSFLGKALFGRWFLAWLLVALFLATLGSVPPLRLLSDELPGDPNAMATQLLPELGGAAVGDEHHGHHFLLGDVVEVAFVSNVQYSVGICYHPLTLFLRELNPLRPRSFFQF